jgi:hypothetical protein
LIETPGTAREEERADRIGGGANQVDVRFRTAAGLLTDTAFLITAFC